MKSNERSSGGLEKSNPYLVLLQVMGCHPEFDTSLDRLEGFEELDGSLIVFLSAMPSPLSSLTGKHHPAIEANRIDPSLPFANHARVIATLLQMFGNVVSP